MDKNRFPAKIARAVAEKLTAELIPTAERIEIAGSLRRNKEFVHDIDVVVLPSADGNAFETALTSLVQRGSLTPVRDGERIKAFTATKTGIPVDLYVETGMFPDTLYHPHRQQESQYQIGHARKGAGNEAARIR